MNNSVLSDLVGSEGVFVDGDWVESKDQDPDGSVRLIQLADVGDGNFIDKSKRYLTEEKAKQLKCTFLEAGDVLVARMPDPIGRACIFPKLNTPCVTVVDVCIVRPDRNKALPEWVKYLVNSPTFRYKISKFVTGTTRQRISRKNLEKIEFRVPLIEQQQEVVNVLDQADNLRLKRKLAIDLLDEFLKSVFLEMFGDPVTNSKNWDRKPLQDFGNVITGNTPSRAEKDNYSDNYIEWIKTDNIVEGKMYLTSANEYLSEIGLRKARFVTSGAVLMACIAGSAESIGRVALADRKVSFNQQINAIQPNEEVNSVYLYWLFRITKSYIQEQATRGMKKILTKGEFEKIEMILPPKELQDKFEQTALRVENLKQNMVAQSSELDNQFNALMQKHFNSN